MADITAGVLGGFFAAENDLAVLRQLFVLVRLSFTPCKTKQMKRAETTDGEKTD